MDTSNVTYRASIEESPRNIIAYNLLLIALLFQYVMPILDEYSFRESGHECSLKAISTRQHSPSLQAVVL